MSRKRLNKWGNPFKVQQREISAEVMKTISELSKTGVKMLNYMMSENCPKDESRIFIDQEDAMFQCDLKSNKSYFNGINDLVKNKIIATSDKHFEYYFNHAYFGEIIKAN